jgi:hypothetical protein
MKKVMKRMCMAALLAIVSTAAMADETVTRVILEKSYTGGTVTAAQGVEAEDHSVVVTLTVTPDPGYYIRKGDITVQLVRDPAAGSRADSEVPMGDAVVLSYNGDDKADAEDLTLAREYTFTVPGGLNAYVSKAEFQSTASIGVEGANVSWSYDETTITITGEGATRDFGGEGVVDPFASVRASVTSIVVEKGVTGLGAGIFAGCTALKSIKIGNAAQVLALGEGAIPANEGLQIDVPGNLYNEYKTTDGWSALTITSSESVVMTNVAFDGSNDYDTFVDPVNNLIVPSVLTAFTVKSVGETSVVLSPITDGVIPAGVPVLLLSKSVDSDDIRTSSTEEKGTAKGGQLKAAPKGGKDVKSIGNIYLLYKDKFYLSQTGTIPENGVYLELKEEQAQKASSRGVLSIGDDGTTGIQQIENGLNLEKNGWYTLDGRRLESAPTRKGLYINNGKKVVIK